MANRPAPPLSISSEDRGRLEAWARSRAIPQREVQRAKVILLAADGVPNREIAARTGCSQPTVRLWRARFRERGISGLQELEGRGHPFTYSEVDVARVITATLKGRPTGSTQWSTRSMAAHLGMSASTVQRIWRAHRLQPHRARTLKFNNDPALEAKVADTHIVGLYLYPPGRVLVLCIDVRTAIQAPDRTRSMPPGRLARQSHEQVRQGTPDLFAALDGATGAATPRSEERDRAAEFLNFVKLVVRTYPGKELHLVVDNPRREETADVQHWLAKHPGIHFHVTPTSGSWMHQVETWFSLLTAGAPRRGAAKTVDALRDAIQRYLEGWSDDRQPFRWVRRPADIGRLQTESFQ